MLNSRVHSNRLLHSNTAEVTPKHPHVCSHEGYKLKRFDDFSQQYGSYALNLLESIKYGFPLRDQVIPSPKDIEPVKTSHEGRNGVEYVRMNCGDIAAGVDEIIEYLQPGCTSSREGFERRAAAGGLWSMAIVDLSGVRPFLRNVRESEIIYPDGSGGLGYLAKGATSTRQITWLYYAHHQTIYDTYALMNVKRATAGSFEHNKGVLKLSTFSGKYTEATLTGLLRALSYTSLVTAQLCQSRGSTSDIINRGKRGYALAKILTSGTLQAVPFISSIGSSQGRARLQYWIGSTSSIHLEANFEPKIHTQKLKNILYKISKISKLEVLGLWCSDAHFSDTVDLVKMAFQGQATLEFVHLSSPHSKATFDRAYFDAQVGTLPPPLNSPRSADMRVLHWFGSLIHTFAIDDTTTEEEVVFLRDCAVFPYLVSLVLKISDTSTPYPYGIGQEISTLETYASRGTDRVLCSPKAHELIRIVSQSPLLSSLNLRYTYLDSKDWEAVLDALDYRRLKSLNLNFTNFSNAQATILMDRLEGSSSSLSLAAVGEIQMWFIPMGRVARHAFKERVEARLPQLQGGDAVIKFGFQFAHLIRT
ncbi:hypothetical protein BG015_002880 [Linnemannia schmuckeri]|uniref:Uncharacterized protein n=1 Tax=Linnemannia schmuckeri TaxID=64567 RepID=A0A9P5S9M7_9FUNG|nr:hypothetical protein BG015_002880 [Linnemannia schmuckeri]